MTDDDPCLTVCQVFRPWMNQLFLTEYDNVMDDTKKASRVEWLCAAMIDFIPVVLITYLDIFLNRHMCLSGTMSALAILLAVYMLLKDFLFDGRSFGKRFVDIRVVWPEDSDKSCLIIRNLPLSLMVLLWGCHDMSQIFELPSNWLKLGFELYIWADLICVALKGKTLGDYFAHTSLEVSGDPNYVLHKKATKRIACLVIVLILSLRVANFISPSNLLYIDESLMYILYPYVLYLAPFFPYMCALYVLYKIIKTYLQGDGIDVEVVVMILILLIAVPVICFLLMSFLDRFSPPSDIFPILFIALMIIAVIIFPVVYLCEEIVRRKELRWLIYALVSLREIISLSPYFLCLTNDSY